MSMMRRLRLTGVSNVNLIGTDLFNFFSGHGKAREWYHNAFAKGLKTDYILTIRTEQAWQLGDDLMALSNYEIMEKIFEGSGTIIYKASDRDAGRLVTIKLLKGGSLSEYKRAQFQPEERTSQGP